MMILTKVRPMTIKLINKKCNMRSISPKGTNNESFKYSVLILLHYYD